MKKGVILFTFIFIGIMAFASNTPAWLETSTGKIDCKEINLGYNKAQIIMNNGKEAEIDLDDVNSFSMDGKVFTKLMLYEDNKPTQKMVFMELIKTWNDLSFYRLRIQKFGSGHSGNVVSRYYLYKGTDYYLELEDRGLKNTCINFGVDYRSL